ncbi:MAG: SpoIIE family protein phosphatase [Prevotellaceae bacterium]|nr:SpoIIE family protein phosphatase [Candidatus Colivivens caballi]
MKKILGLKTYINLTLIVILIGGAVFTTGFGACLYMARTEVTRLTKEGFEHDMKDLHEYVDGILQRVEDAAYSFSWAEDPNYALFDINDFSSEEDMFVMLENFLDIHPYICGIAIGLEKPIGFATAGKYGFASYVTNVTGENVRMPLGFINDYKQKEWYSKAARLDKAYWSLPFRESLKDKLVTCFSLPLHDETGKVVGVLALDVDTERFRKECNAIMPFEHTEVTIVDRHRRYICHPDTAMLLEHITEGNVNGWTDEHKREVLMNAKGSFVLERPDGRSAFYYDTIKRTGWTIGLECPMDEIFYHLNMMKINTTVIAVISILLMIVCFIYLFRRLQKVTLSKAGMENELKIASDIQMGMIPKTYPAFPDISELDVFGYLKPAKSVGGDLYDYFIRDNKLFFCIGDVSGKGVPASLFMSVVRALFRNVSMRCDDPAEVVSSINTALSQGNDQGMFCTMFLGVLDMATGRMEYCNAGHDAPIVTDRNGNARFLQVETNLAVGVMEEFPYVKNATEILVGDSIFLYTDGVTEAENTAKTLFGMDATLRLVSQSFANAHGMTVKDIIGNIYSSLKKYTAGAEQNDDITMVIVSRCA